MKLAPRLLQSALFVAGLSVASAAQSATIYRIDKLGAPPDFGSSIGYSINESGQVAGERDFIGFVYSQGKFSSIGTLPVTGNWQSRGLGINNSGEVAGWSSYVAPPEAGGGISDHAVIYKNGSLVDLGTPGGAYSYASAINNQSQVTGWANVFNPNLGIYQYTAFSYSQGSSFTTIGTLGGAESYGYAINNAGQIAGYSLTSAQAGHAFLYDPAKGMQDLGTLAPGGTSMALAVNDAGVVVGTSSPGTLINDPTEFRSKEAHGRAFIYRDGVMSDLGLLGSAYSFRSEAFGINNLADVVGRARVNGQETGFLYTDGQMIDLNSVLDQATGADWKIVEARDINDRGEITGWGLLGGTQTAFVLTPCETCQGPPPGPVPEPGTCALMLAGLGVTWPLVRRRMRRGVGQ